MQLKNFFRALLILIGVLILIGNVGMLFAQDSDDVTIGIDIEDEAGTIALLESRGVEVVALEDITVEGPILRDVTPTSARLYWVGTIPTGCLLLFGETPDFGNATQDPNMAGAAIIEHNPVMRGLQPETTYYYRLQGSDESGRFFISPVYSFTTPPESDEISDNLLSPQRGAEIVAVSSNWRDQPNVGSTWGVANAFDDDPNTAWSSDGDGDDAFVEVALGQRSQIREIEFWTRTMSNNTAQIFSFTVTTEAGIVFGPYALPDPDSPYTFEVDFVAETLRFDVAESNGGNTGAVEIAVYGDPIE